MATDSDRLQPNSQGAQAQDFQKDITAIVQRLHNIKQKMWDLNRGAEDLLVEEERRLTAMHRERQNAATVGQRRYEAASGQPPGAVPFQVPPPA